MNRFEAMSVLLAVVDQGGFSAAARHLRMPLATVSRKVADLEALLKIRILNRTTRRVELTDQGRSYVASCRRLLADLDEAERKASGEYTAPRGQLVITAPVSFGRLHLLPIVSDFLQAYPDIDVQLLLSDRVADLLEEHIDISLRIGKLPETSMKAVKVGEVKQIVCASPDYLKRRGTPKTLRDLSKHDCITHQSLMSATAWSFLVNKRRHDIAVHSRLAVSMADAAVTAAIAGVGITRLVSYQVAAAIREGSLVPLFAQHEPAALPVHLLHSGQRIIPLKLRAFLDFATPRLRQRCAESK